MFEPGSITGGTITLAVACVGVGTVAFPLAFAKAGILLSAILLISIGTFTVLSIRHLAFGVEVLKLGSYEDMSRVLLGKRYEDIIRVMLLFLNFGVCVGYVVVLAEMLGVITPQIQSGLLYFSGAGEHFVSSRSTTHAICSSSSGASSSSHKNESPLRGWSQQAIFDLACSSHLGSATLAVFWLLVLFPLSLAKSMNSMRFASSMAILSTCFIMACVVYRYFVPFVNPEDPILSAHSKGSPPSSLDHPSQHPIPAVSFNFMTLLALPIMMYSLDCQCFVFQIYNDLSISNRSMHGMTTVGFSAISIACVFFFGVGTFGALSFGDNTKGNILQNYDPLHDPLLGLGFVLYSFPIVMAFAFTLFPCRDAVFNAVYGLNATNIEITSAVPPSTTSRTVTPTTTAPTSPNVNNPVSSTSSPPPVSIGSATKKKKQHTSAIADAAAAAVLQLSATTPEDDMSEASSATRKRRNGGAVKSVSFQGQLVPYDPTGGADVVPVYPSYHHSYQSPGSNTGISSILPRFPEVVLPHSFVAGSQQHSATVTASDNSCGGSFATHNETFGEEEEDNNVDGPSSASQIEVDTGAFYMSPKTFYLWSTALSLSALLVAILTPGIVVVIGLLGAMCSSTLCFTYPALFRIAMDAHELVPFYRPQKQNGEVNSSKDEANINDRSNLLSSSNHTGVEMEAATTTSYGAIGAEDTNNKTAEVAALSQEDELKALKADSNCCLPPSWWDAERLAYGELYFYFYIRFERVMTYAMMWLGLGGCVLGTTVASYKIVMGE